MIVLTLRNRNPLKKLPALSDDGLVIIESHTILRYLAEKFGNGNTLYPSETKSRLQVDMYLDWFVSLALSSSASAERDLTSRSFIQ